MMKKIFICFLLISFYFPLSLAQQKPDLHKPWNEILQTYVKDGTVSYRELKGNASDMKKLDTYLEVLGKANIKNFSLEGLLAFWINAYNSFTVKLILNHYPLKSIRDIKDPWKQKIWLAAGERFSLNDIEHNILRKDLNEPRIHFAIVCASRGCPKLNNKSYKADSIHQELDKITRSFFSASQNFLIKKSGNVTTLYLSRIFKWFGNDFGSNEQQRIDFILPYLSESDAVKINNAQKIKVKYLNYDWSLNGV